MTICYATSTHGSGVLSSFTVNVVRGTSVAASSTTTSTAKRDRLWFTSSPRYPDTTREQQLILPGASS